MDFSDKFLGVAALITGMLLLHTSYPAISISAFAWVALVPLLTLLRLTSYLTAFFSSLLFGTAWWALHLRWVNHIPSFNPAAFITLILFCALFFGFFGLLYAFVSQRTRIPRVLAAPVLWVSLEFIRYNLRDLSLPWGLLGHSQYEWTSIIQIASITSVYGISFLIVLVNAALAEVCLWLLSRRQTLTIRQPTFRSAAISLAAALFAVTAAWGWGRHEIKSLAAADKSMLKVSLVSGDTPEYVKRDKAYFNRLKERYRKLTLQAAKDHPDLIVWPESSTPGYIRGDPNVLTYAKNITDTTHIPLLVGSSSRGKIRVGDEVIKKSLDGAFLVDGNGNIAFSYHKMILVPFGEYLPFEGYFSWPKWLVPETGTTLAGTSRTIFKLQGEPFGVVICWESLFPEHFRKFVSDGCRFMVNMNNEAWFEEPAPSNSSPLRFFAPLKTASRCCGASTGGSHALSILQVKSTGRARKAIQAIMEEACFRHSMSRSPPDRLSIQETVTCSQLDVFCYRL